MAILQGKGAHLASSVEEIAHTAQIIMTMLPATQYVEAVVGQVLIPHAKAGTLLIDGSTIDPTASKALAAQALARGLEMVDAPVLNSSSGRSWVTELYNPCPGVIPSAPSSNDYQGGFASRLMQKDLGIAGDAAKK
eukprot:evm.model.NODE_2219_length_28325_cov_37.384148.11